MAFMPTDLAQKIRDMIPHVAPLPSGGCGRLEAGHGFDLSVLTASVATGFVPYGNPGNMHRGETTMRQSESGTMIPADVIADLIGRSRSS